MEPFKYWSGAVAVDVGSGPPTTTTNGARADRRRLDVLLYLIFALENPSDESWVLQ